MLSLTSHWSRESSRVTTAGPKQCTDASPDAVDCAETLFGRTFELICMSAETNSDRNKENYNNNKAATLNFRETKQK